MKIAILADPIDNQRGGVHVYTRELVKALLHQDRENDYLLVREKNQPEFPGATSMVVPPKGPGLLYRALRMFLLIPRRLRQAQVDVVVEPAHFGPFNLPKRVKRVTVIHDLTPLLFPQYHRWHSQLLQRLFLKRILKKSSLVISNSRHTTQDILRFFPFLAGRVVTAHLGVGPSLKETTGQAYLEQLGLKPGYWLSVGTLEPRKNGVRLLEAYQRFRASGGVAAPLIVAGQRGWKAGAFYEALEQHPYRQDIILTGFVPDDALPELYSHAMALLYLSEYEGFGLPVLEALTCGCPVICADNSSLPEVGGTVAYYADCRDTETVAQHMKAIAGLSPPDRASLKAKALAWARQFSWAAHAEACLKGLQKLSIETTSPIGRKPN